MQADDINALALAGQRAERLRREFEGHPGPAHCPHTVALGFHVAPPCPQAPNGVIAVQKTCCWCGPTRMHYVGIVEPGHGPWVTFDEGSKLAIVQG